MPKSRATSQNASAPRATGFATRWSGVLVTLGAGLLLAAFHVTPTRIPYPGILFVVAIIYSTFTGGFPAGFASAALSISFAALILSIPGAPLRYTHADLQRLWVSIAVFPSIALLVGLLKRRDYLRARNSADARARRQADDLLQGLDAIVWEADARTGAFLFVSRRAVELLGYRIERWSTDPDFWAGILHTEDRERVLAQRRDEVEEGRVQVVEYRMTTANGGTVWVRDHVRVIRDASGAPLQCGLMFDITEFKRTEAALERSEELVRLSQKMDAVGRLAGGVAHDFNNLLTVILGHSEQMLAELPAGDPQRPGADEIRRAAERAADLTHQLLAFSRRQVLAPVVLDLNSVTADMHSLLGRLIGEDIELRTVHAADLGHVKADRSQIEQVIVNLAVNARDAMPAGGRLTIEAANTDLDASASRGLVQVVPGPYVLLAVSDNGTGMSPELVGRVFEPFFTTKESGKGTGLGLATVYGIVKQSGGYIWVYSEPGIGTTFKIYLPRVDEKLGPESAAPAAATRGREVVLVIEDDDHVRKLLSDSLTRRGYTVLTAEHGERAVEVAARYDGPIHLLVTDVVMPRMGGREVAERIGAMRPDLRTLFISGYTDDAIVHHGVLDAGLAFLPKPFTPEVLARKVREVLDAVVTS